MQAVLITLATSLLWSASTGDTEPTETSSRVAYIKDHFGEMHFKPEGGFLLTQGQTLPNLVWDEPEVAEALLDETTIPTRWFDHDFNEVKTAEKAGRYYVYGEAPAPDGPPLRRAMTCCCLETNIDLESLAVKLYPGTKKTIEEIVKGWRENEEEVITLLGKLDSSPPYKPKRPGQWHMDNATVHVRLKRKLRNLTSPPVIVKPRSWDGKPAPVLARNPDAWTDADREFGSQMEALFKRWHRSSKQPMSVVAARHGNVLVSRGYGRMDGKPVTAHTPMLLHSAMKPIMGIQLAMYVDRDIVDFEQPVGDFLPEFDTPRDQGLTFRAGHVHVTGIHFPWDLAFSRLFYFHTWHEALIAHCPREWAPGDRFRYGVVGIILAVRSLELLTAKNYWEAIEAQLLDPLDIKDVYPGGTGFSAEGLAKLGVLMANRGRYGDLEFFSEETHAAIVPVPLKDHYPKIDAQVEWGVGFAPMGPGRYGHGGGCGTYLLVVPDKHLVFAFTRMEKDSEYGRFHAEAIELLEELVKRSPSADS